MQDIIFPLKVMEPILVEEVPLGEYLYQVKWDGIRWVTFKTSQGLLFQTKGQRVFKTRFPELETELGWLPPLSMIDGEVVALENGKPNFLKMLKRIHTFSRKTVGIASREPAVEYIVFDALYWQGKDLRSLPLIERLAILAENMPKFDRCHCIENFADGRQLWQAVQAMELEGIVAKSALSPYLPGKDPAWVKIKRWQFGEFLIGGLKFKSGNLKAICLGKYLDKDFLYVGSVANGISKLSEEKYPEFIARTTSPFSSNTPHPSQGEEIYWVEPELSLTIRFLEWTDGGKLRHAKVI